MTYARQDGRQNDEMRAIGIERGFTSHAEGSVLVVFGDTKIVCTASVEKGVPVFLRGSGIGWITAEYGMLPRSTNERMGREAAKGKQGGRTVEIQRLIGRSLRASVDMKCLGEYTIRIDCDVLQADGGTRTASITGACVALYDAIKSTNSMNRAGNPFAQWVASVSVGMLEGVPLLDLNYVEDSGAETDMNVVMTESGGLIEVQGTAEKQPFSRKDLDSLVDLASSGISQLITLQKEAVEG